MNENETGIFKDIHKFIFSNQGYDLLGVVKTSVLSVEKLNGRKMSGSDKKALVISIVKKSIDLFAKEEDKEKLNAFVDEHLSEVIDSFVFVANSAHKIFKKRACSFR